MKYKLVNYPTETEHEAMGQKQRTEDHGTVIFASVFFFLPSYIPHLSMHLEKSRRLILFKRSADDLELFDDQRRKSARII